ncbi:family 16 glycosylhydrolase [Actinotalea ferrariae]|uniref:carbohydrate binding domain-containing protein n=1 Tax=Actinotalea ferrariae TaxID=1386098 RepID=UPI001C8C3429|nr:carbohydrate binding domain-containing protein [Actinotalea ferrariae]MBX9243401.1 family 16 glycosylhydrolase [Actinotalea ferrariae]
MTARHWLAAALAPAVVLPLVMAAPASAASVSTIADFEGSAEPPATFYSYGGAGGGAGFGVVTVQPGDPLARPDQEGANNVLSVGIDVPTGYAGFGENLAALGDWSAFDGLQFWMQGTNSGAVLQSELLEEAPGGGEGERFDVTFTDNWTGWRLVQLPFAGYAPAADHNPAPENGVLDLEKVRGYIFPVVSGTTTFAMDDIGLYAGTTVAPTVGFAASTAGVAEGGTAALTVRLNVASESTVTVDLATSDGTATAGEDYTAVETTVTFTPGVTTQTVDVVTAQDTEAEGNETVVATLSSPDGATLSTDTLTLTVRDDDAAPASEVWDNVRVVTTFAEPEVPVGEDADGNTVGFERFTDPNASSEVAFVAPPAPVPGKAADDQAARVTLRAPSYAGFTNKLTNDSVDAWVPQDWSRYDGVSFWLYGQNTGHSLFIDILDNRNPDSTVDDAGRYSVAFTDDTLGWRYVELPFSSFTRKDVGNGAPNDGLTLNAMHGWAFGATAVPATTTWYLEDFALTVPETVVDEFEYASLPSGQDANGVGIGFHTYNGPGASASAGVTTGAPADSRPSADEGNTVLDLTMDVPAGSWGGVSHAFAEDGTWVSQDWTDHQGLNFWFHGDGSGEQLYVDIVENRPEGSTTDNAERHSATFTDDVVGWRFVELEWADFSRKEIGNGAPNDGLTLEEVHGYAIGAVTTDGPQDYAVDRLAVWGASLDDVPLVVGFDRGTYGVTEGDAATLRVTLSRPSETAITVDYATVVSTDRTQTEDGAAVPGRDYTAVEGTLTFAPGETLQTFVVQTTEDAKHELAESVQVQLSDAAGGTAEISGFARSASVSITDDDPEDPLLVEDFESAPGLWRSENATLESVRVLADSDDAYPGQAADEGVGEVVVTGAGAAVRRDFAQPQDWSGQEGLSFWYRGTGSGEPVTVALRDDSAPDPGPEGWTNVVYRDDFDASAGTPVDPTTWSNETGGWGWGNAEHQYYTPGSQNVWQDGEGNLEIELRPNTDESLWCSTNGAPCGYTSARIATQGKAEFLYGRIEARLKVPAGEGLWPAFWTLGNDFLEVGWPQTGEIDIMEHVEGDNGRPWESFGTVHGPGYSGGQSVGHKVCLDDAGEATTCPRTSGESFSDEFHTYGVEWEPDRITWLLDGEPFGSVTPEELPGEWVFDHPYFLIANMAIGGNFGGTIEPGLELPASYLIDYIQVEQAPDTAERFETTFVDDSEGWQQITVPFDAFERSAAQPAGAPDNGLTLSSVNGLGITLADGASGTVLLDELRVGPVVTDPGTVPGTPGGPGTPGAVPGAPVTPGTGAVAGAGGAAAVARGSLGATGVELWAVAASMVLLLAGTALVVATSRRRLAGD